MRAGWTGLKLAVVAALLTVGPVHAEMRRIVCKFPEGSRVLIMPEIILHTDIATGNTRIEDKLIIRSIGNPVRADVQEARNKRLLRTFYTWRVDGIPHARSYLGFVDFRMKVEADGQAFIETTNAMKNKKETARGRCS